jgi:hypothetical protein
MKVPTKVVVPTMPRHLSSEPYTMKVFWPLHKSSSGCSKLHMLQAMSPLVLNGTGIAATRHRAIRLRVPTIARCSCLAFKSSTLATFIIPEVTGSIGIFRYTMVFMGGCISLSSIPKRSRIPSREHPVCR